MASFRVKLVLYFLLLSLLPVAAAFWGFSTVAAHGETKRVDERLQAGLRASLAGYQQRIDSAQATATSLAAANWFKRDLEENDDAAVRRALTRYPNVEITGPFDHRVLRAAVDELIRRHELLRTTIIDGVGKKIDVRPYLKRIALGEGDAARAVDAARLAGDFVMVEVDLEIRGSGAIKITP